jgi:UDP-N-acetylmuramate: L-alanyl-gamma-D-glutamyl-meso-diaminopimelate ligase
VDLVVTGAMVKRGNPELEGALDRGIPVRNAAAFLQEYFAQHTENFVVAGTKGKTTTTAMVAWILRKAGKSPDHVIGGQVRGLADRVRLTGASRMVLEGDEYRCGLGDPQPKFLRYHPQHLLITNVSLDHHEIYPVASMYRDAFRQLISQVPRRGSITVSADDAGVMSLVGDTPTPVTSVGVSKRAAVAITHFRETSSGTSFRVSDVAFQLSLPGRMNALNAALAAVMARQAGVPLEKSARALASFRGVEGRLEIIASVGRSRVYVDEAYHPLALRATLEALRSRHPRRRIVLLFEPRYTGGADGPWKQELPRSLTGAVDVVIAGPAVELEAKERPFDVPGSCRALRRRGVKAYAVAELDAIEQAAARHCREGDIVLISLSLIRGELTDRVCSALKQALAAQD